jgi:hypothetical protein
MVGFSSFPFRMRPAIGQESSGEQAAALLELPLGPSWDAAATFRSIRHRRRVVNGVSGFDPPHYAPLQEGLNARDPEMLLALASLSPIDVVVDRDADRGGALKSYVSSTSGAQLIGEDGPSGALSHRICAGSRVDCR